MIRIGHYLLAAIEVGSLGGRQCRDWADRLVVLLDRPEAWILELATATSIEDARIALRDRIEKEESYRGGIISIGNLKLGFLVIRLEKGELTQHEVLVKAGELAEGGFTDIGSSEIYYWLNLIEDGTERTFPSGLFARYRQLAISALEEIRDYVGDETGH